MAIMSGIDQRALTARRSETIQKLMNMRDYELSAASLRHDPIWGPIRKDPGFDKAIGSLDAKEVK